MRLQLSLHAGQLVSGRKLTVKEKVHDLFECRAFCQVMDVETTIEKGAVLSVDQACFTRIEINLSKPSVERNLRLLACYARASRTFRST